MKTNLNSYCFSFSLAHLTESQTKAKNHPEVMNCTATENEFCALDFLCTCLTPKITQTHWEKGKKVSATWKKDQTSLSVLGYKNCLDFSDEKQDFCQASRTTSRDVECSQWHIQVAQKIWGISHTCIYLVGLVTFLRLYPLMREHSVVRAPPIHRKQAAVKKSHEEYHSNCSVSLLPR